MHNVSQLQEHYFANVNIGCHHQSEPATYKLNLTQQGMIRTNTETSGIKTTLIHIKVMEWLLPTICEFAI